LTARCHGYNIVGKSDEGQDTSLRVGMGNAKLSRLEYQEEVCFERKGIIRGTNVHRVKPSESGVREGGACP